MLFNNLILPALFSVLRLGGNGSIENQPFNKVAQEGHSTRGNVNLRQNPPFHLRNYYFSKNTASWTTAARTCLSLFGQQSGLLSIETVEELTFLKSAFKDFESEQKYWTSGSYQMTDPPRWIWNVRDKQVPIGDFISVVGDLPSSEDRLALNIQNGDNPSFEKVQIYQEQRYICETSSSLQRSPLSQSQPLSPRRDVSGALIIGKPSNLCLTVKGGSTADDVAIDIWTCVDQDNQKWDIKFTGAAVLIGWEEHPVFRLVSKWSKKCLGTYYGSKQNGGSIVQQECLFPFVSPQLWYAKWSRSPTDTMELIHVDSGRCVSVENGVTTVGGNAIIYDCKGAPHQSWVMRPTPN